MLLKVEDVATLLNVCSRTVHRMRRRGELDFVMVGRHVRYPIVQFERFIGRDTLEAIKRRVYDLANPQSAMPAARVPAPEANPHELAADISDEEEAFLGTC